MPITKETVHIYECDRCPRTTNGMPDFGSKIVKDEWGRSYASDSAGYKANHYLCGQCTADFNSFMKRPRD